MAAPTEAGRADAMLAAIRMEVPLPSFKSVSSDAICSNQMLEMSGKALAESEMKITASAWFKQGN